MPVYEIYDVAVPEMHEPILAGKVEVEGDKITLLDEEGTYESIKEVAKEPTLDVPEAKTAGDLKLFRFRSVKPGDKGYFEAFRNSLRELGFALQEEVA